MYRKTQFILRANSHMLRNQVAILMKLNSNKGLPGMTSSCRNMQELFPYNKTN
jgi:hypothetical protein